MSFKGSRSILVLLAAWLLLSPLPASGQGIGGSITGVVKDESGAAVPAAVVKLTNAQTAQVRSVSTDNEGRYQLREVPPGEYDLSVERPGFNTAKVQSVRISVAQVAKLDDIQLNVASIGQEIVVNVQADVALTDVNSPTLSTSFSDKQIRELPVLTRDLNNLALLAPGVFSVRTFSFASTLVPFAANGSRGRDNNFIIDSVDNNEPLFGGAATQFTNTDLFTEYRILTNQYKSEYGRNSGSVVNIITERGGNQWRGSAFFFGQHDYFNAANTVESTAGLKGTTRYYETQAGATLGGPLVKEKAWFFTSYQWDRARADLSPTYPVLATLPTPVGLNALIPFANSPTVGALLRLPTAITLPGRTSPCGQAGSGLPANNPCTVGTVSAISPVSGLTVNIPFGTFLVPNASVFDVRDHQLSGRWDQRLGQRDDVYVRYLFDDLQTPRTAGTGAPAEVAFSDFGLLPEFRTIVRQRTQSLGLFWTRAWATALHELRGSYARISSQVGSFGVPSDIRDFQPAITIFDGFALSPGTGSTAMAAANLLSLFPAAGQVITIGRDTRPSVVNSNIFQLQDNFSWSKGAHGLKVGVNLVRTQSNIRQIPSDLGQYFYLPFFDPFAGRFVSGFEAFATNQPGFAIQRLGNFRGRGGDTLPMREFGHFYFFQDDYRITRTLTFSLGVRYENYGQALNKVAELNPGFGPKVERDDSNIAPRIGFAWSPDGRWVVRGGYGIYYNPTVFNIALITWQGGRVSPFVFGVPQNVFPDPPFVVDPTSAPPPSGPCTGATISAIDCTTADTVSLDLVNPMIQNFSLTMQRQLGRDLLVEVSYVGSKGRSLFQRLDRNPNQGYTIVTTTTVTPACPTPPCVTATLRGRRNPNRGGITEVTNNGKSDYHALQVSATHRLSGRVPLALTAAYTWSHMLDNASEIFGPGLRLTDIGQFVAGTAQGSTTEVITPFPQNPNDPSRGERGNSAFDRRHRVAVSFLYLLPSPDAGAAKWFFGDWQINGLFTGQTGQPFTPLNGFGTCRDANGDGLLTNDRPLIGNPNALKNTVAVLRNCASTASGYVRPGTTTPVFTPADARQNSRFVQAPFNVLGDAGRNILRGPNVINLDVAVFKNFPWGERRNFQFRIEAYNVLNRANPGNAIGNVFTSDAQPVPAIAFLPGVTPSRATGVIPENTLDAVDPVSNRALFLDRKFMNTAPRRFQFGLKLLF